MEINKLNDLYIKLSEKYSYQLIDTDNDGNITETEVLSLAYQDADLRAELDDSDLELIKDVIPVEESLSSTSESNQNNMDNLAIVNNLFSNFNQSDIQQLIIFLCTLLQATSLSGTDLLNVLQNNISVLGNQNSNISSGVQTKARRELKSMDEYIEIINNKYDKLWEKFSGDTDKITKYINNNLGEYADIDGDGEITVIDKAIWAKYQKEYSTNGADSNFNKDKNEKGQNYAQGKKRFFSGKLQNAINNSINSSLIDFYDLEDLYTIGGTNKDLSNLGINITNLINKNLNYNIIAQDENWEEKLNSLCDKIGIKENNISTAKNNIKKSYDYIKNNPKNAKYAALSPLYEQYLSNVEKINNSTNKTDEDYGVYGYSKADAIDASIKGLFQAGIDLNGDGKFNADDLALFSCDIDLDGDGKVSNQEAHFLKKAKEKLKEVLWSKTANNGYYNSNKIDDLISYLDNFDESTYIKNKKTELNNRINTYVKNTVLSENPGSQCYKNGEFIIGNRRAYGFLLATGAVIAPRLGYLDGTDGVFPADVENNLDSTITGSETKSLIAKSYEYERPLNTYLHYIKSADLSKEELTEILNKINSSSASVQSQLAEVKKVIEEKLGGMN